MPPPIGRPDLWARLTVRMEPFAGQPQADGRAGSRVAEATATGPYLKAALDVLGEQGEGAARSGFPLMNVKITILGGEVHETESSEMAFRLAAADAFNKGLREAGIVLLEPIMRLEITVPEENLGDIVSDLQQRRASSRTRRAAAATR